MRRETLVALDIDTAKGQQTKVWEEACMTLLAHHTGLTWSKTKEPCEVDGVLTDPARNLRFVVEQKSRQMTYDRLMRDFDGYWLVTADKLRHLRAAARMFHAPALGVLYLVPDETVLVLRLIDDAGELLVPIRIERTTTQATVNGGTAVRDNAFISMKKAAVYRPLEYITHRDIRW